MGWNYLSIHNVNGCTVEVKVWIKKFHPIHYWACDYLSVLGFKLNHVSKKGHRNTCTNSHDINIVFRNVLVSTPEVLIMDVNILYVVLCKFNVTRVTFGNNSINSMNVISSYIRSLKVTRHEQFRNEAYYARSLLRRLGWMKIMKNSTTIYYLMIDCLSLKTPIYSNILTIESWHWFRNIHVSN